MTCLSVTRHGRDIRIWDHVDGQPATCSSTFDDVRMTTPQCSRCARARRGPVLRHRGRHLDTARRASFISQDERDRPPSASIARCRPRSHVSRRSSVCTIYESMQQRPGSSASQSAAHFLGTAPCGLWSRLPWSQLARSSSLSVRSCVRAYSSSCSVADILDVDPCVRLAISPAAASRVAPISSCCEVELS